MKVVTAVLELQTPNGVTQRKLRIDTPNGLPEDRGTFLAEMKKSVEENNPGITVLRVIELKELSTN